MKLLAARNNNKKYDWALACSYGDGIYHECGYNFTKMQVQNIGRRFKTEPEFISYEQLFNSFGMIDEHLKK